MSRIIEYIIFFAAVVVAQLLLFDNIQITGYLNIIIYPIFVILLPANIKGGFLLLSTAALGCVADIVSGTMGLYSIALVLLGFIRGGVLRVFVREDVLDSIIIPNSGSLGLKQFLEYLSLMTIVFFTVVMMLERLTFDYFSFTLIRILFSSVVSICVMYALQLPFSKGKRRNSF